MARAIQTVQVDVTTKLDPNPFTNPSGEVFSHWNTRQDNTGESYQNEDDITIDQPITLYAQWGHEITWNATGGVSPEPSVVLTGNSIGTLPEPTRSGYVFDGWYTTSDCSVKVNSQTIPAENTTYYAKWNGKKYVSQNLDMQFYAESKSRFNNIFPNWDASVPYPLATGVLSFLCGSERHMTLPRGIYNFSIANTNFLHKGNHSDHILYIVLRVKNAQNTSQSLTPSLHFTNKSVGPNILISNLQLNGMNAIAISGVDEDTNSGHGVVFSGYYWNSQNNGEQVCRLPFENNLLNFEVYMTFGSSSADWCKGFEFNVPEQGIKAARIGDVQEA